jgi:hypothetical protein
VSRISYSDEEDYPGQFDLWRANLRRSLKGRNGRRALRDLEAALLALPDKRLIADHLAANGQVCAVGAIVTHRKVSLGQAREAVLRELEGEPREDDCEEWDDCDDMGETEEVGVANGIPRLVAWRLVELNDMELARFTPEERYEKVLAWARKHLTVAEAPHAG